MFAENDMVEFKREPSKGLMKTVVAFANTHGGVIYIGVEDDGAVCGVDDPEATVLAFTNCVRDSIKPDASMVVQCEAIEANGKPVVGVRVERGAKRPYYLSAKGMRPEGVYVRQGAASYMATEAEIREMLKQAEGLYHEDGRSLQQGLSFDYARESFAEHGMELGDAQMRSLGLVDEDGQFTNLGFLLSDQCPSTMKLAAFFGTKRTKFRGREEPEGSLLKQLEGALDFLAKYTDYETKFVDMRRVDCEDFPPDAAREALFNAVVHRDYAMPAANLVSVLDDRLEITSHGGLPCGTTMEEFQMDVSVPRNPKLAAIFYRLGLIEAYGTGIVRMFEAYEGCGVAPEFHITPNVFRVVLPNRNRPPKGTLVQATEHRLEGSSARDASGGADASDELERQEQVVLSMIELDGPMKRRAIQDRTDFSQATLLRILKRLTDKGLVRAEGNTRRRVYTAT